MSSRSVACGKAFLLGLLALAVSALLGIQPAEAAPTRTPCQKATGNSPQCAKLIPFGHRGSEYAASKTNEDTLAAIKRAHSVKAAAELDFWHLAGSGVFGVVHDPTPKRTVSAASLKAAHVSPNAQWKNVTYAQWKKLRTKGGQPLPTLAQAIAKCGSYKMRCMLEVKWGPTKAEALQIKAQVQKAGCLKTCWFYQQPQDPDSKYPCFMTGVDTLGALGLTVGIKMYPGKCPHLEKGADLKKHHYKFAAITTGSVTASRVANLHKYGILAGPTLSSTTSGWKKLVMAKADFIIAKDPVALTRWLR